MTSSRGPDSICLLQADLSNKDSQVADVQENIKSQQAETSKAKDELKGTLTAMEQLKDGFKSERAEWETEKATLLKRAEDAEATLKPVAEELTGLKRQVNAMTSAIFGKYSLQEPFLNIFDPAGLTASSSTVAGSRVAHLGSDMRKKLKAAYTLIEQLYTGAQ